MDRPFTFSCPQFKHRTQQLRRNGIEALDDLLDTSLSKVIIPLVDDMDTETRLHIGRKHFKLKNMEDDSDALIRYLLKQEDWVSVVLPLL